MAVFAELNFGTLCTLETGSVFTTTSPLQALLHLLTNNFLWNRDWDPDLSFGRGRGQAWNARCSLLPLLSIAADLEKDPGSAQQELRLIWSLVDSGTLEFRPIKAGLLFPSVIFLVTFLFEFV